MSEFSNRISAQRKILQTVNSRSWEQEDLLGLSSNAIDRWVSVNGLPRDTPLVALVTTAAEKLFFLANKSQEQVSEDYQSVSQEIEALTVALNREIG